MKKKAAFRIKLPSLTLLMTTAVQLLAQGGYRMWSRYRVAQKRKRIAALQLQVQEAQRKLGP